MNDGFTFKEIYHFLNDLSDEDYDRLFIGIMNFDDEVENPEKTFVEKCQSDVDNDIVYAIIPVIDDRDEEVIDKALEEASKKRIIN